MFAAAPCRATPDFSPTANPFILTIDFSKTAIGAVLSQEQDNVEKFLGVKGENVEIMRVTIIVPRGNYLPSFSA